MKDMAPHSNIINLLGYCTTKGMPSMDKVNNGVSAQRNFVADVVTKSRHVTKQCVVNVP